MIEDLLIGVISEHRIGTFWLDDRYLEIHAEAQREAYGDTGQDAA